MHKKKQTQNNLLIIEPLKLVKIDNVLYDEIIIYYDRKIK
jgi:hypothetical protein